MIILNYKIRIVSTGDLTVLQEPELESRVPAAPRKHGLGNLFRGGSVVPGGSGGYPMPRAPAATQTADPRASQATQAQSVATAGCQTANIANTATDPMPSPEQQEVSSGLQPDPPVSDPLPTTVPLPSASRSPRIRKETMTVSPAPPVVVTSPSPEPAQNASDSDSFQEEVEQERDEDTLATAWIDQTDQVGHSSIR